MRTLKFEELKLSPALLNGLKDHNYTELTELQEEVVPVILEGKDVFIKTKEGDDKITSFLIPALEQIIHSEQIEGTTALILTPSEKTVQKIDALVSTIGSDFSADFASISSGTGAEEINEILQSGTKIIAAHPAPLLESMQNLLYIFRHVKLVVIDTANEMISNNLIDSIDLILKRVLNDHQTLLYTSEVNEKVKGLAKDKLDEPVAIGLNMSDSRTDTHQAPPKIESDLSHGYIYVPNRMKISTLMAHIDDNPDDICVIFTASKRGTDRLYKILRKRNSKVTSLHGKLSDKKRSQRFANFANGDIQYLLVADIPAAELDLRDITRVINYDVPNDPDEYRYRANLVGSGKASQILSLVSKQDRNDINVLESELAKAPKEHPLPDKVKQKLKQRSKKKSSNKSSRNGHNKRHKKNKKDNDMQLPRPSYDKLSGGRKGGHSSKDAESGVIGLIKKLFS